MPVPVLRTPLVVIGSLDLLNKHPRLKYSHVIDQESVSPAWSRAWPSLLRTNTKRLLEVRISLMPSSNHKKTVLKKKMGHILQVGGECSPAVSTS